MMDLNIFLPNTNQNWIVKNNTIYYRRYALIPVLRIIDDIIWVSLDRRISNVVLRIIKHLMGLKVEFFLTNRLLVHEKHIYQEDLENIIYNYLICLTDEDFFDSIFDTGFDYIGNITSFLNTYDSHELFRDIYTSIKKKFLVKYTDWITMKKVDVIKKEHIRDFIQKLERGIKLKILIED